MKKVLALILAVVLAIGLAGCSASGKTLQEVKDAGELVIATSPDFPPFESLEGSEVVGIEVDIMKLICEKLGVSYKFEQMDFDSVLIGIEAAKFDCAMSGITVTPAREKNMLFTDPYYVAAQVIVVKEDSAIKGKADLAGKKVSVQTGTTADEGCKAEKLDVSAFQANADAKAALTTGKVDAWVVDNLTAIQMVEEGDGLKILDENMTEEPYAFAFAKGSEDLVEEINKALKELVDSGKVEEIFTAYGETYVKP